jgi:hypothetical protein
LLSSGWNTRDTWPKLEKRPLTSGLASAPALLPNMLHRSSPPSKAEVNSGVNSGLDLLRIEVDFASSSEFSTTAENRLESSLHIRGHTNSVCWSRASKAPVGRRPSRQQRWRKFFLGHDPNEEVMRRHDWVEGVRLDGARGRASHLQVRKAFFRNSMRRQNMRKPSCGFMPALLLKGRLFF